MLALQTWKNGVILIMQLPAQFWETGLWSMAGAKAAEKW